MKLLPVALNVRNKRCLVVGGGIVAQRKTEALLECEAHVSVIAPQLCDGFASLMARLEYWPRPFQAGDCEGAQLVFACTDQREVNASVAREARERHIWYNVADDGDASDFHTAATVRRGDICVGITTTAGSPALARHLKSRIEACVPPEYSELLEMLNVRRNMVKDKWEQQSARAGVWRGILESDALELLKNGQHTEAEALIDKLIQNG